MGELLPTSYESPVDELHHGLAFVGFVNCEQSSFNESVYDDARFDFVVRCIFENCPWQHRSVPVRCDEAEPRNEKAGVTAR